jgi:hypothetical protein
LTQQLNIMGSGGIIFNAFHNIKNGMGLPDWAGVADVHGDGKDDLLWYHAGLQQLHVIGSTGGTFNGTYSILGGMGNPDWAANGSLSNTNGDGMP